MGFCSRMLGRCGNRNFGVDITLFMCPIAFITGILDSEEDKVGKGKICGAQFTNLRYFNSCLSYFVKVRFLLHPTIQNQVVRLMRLRLDLIRLRGCDSYLGAKIKSMQSKQ